MSRISLFDTWPKKRAPIKHFKNRGFSKVFFNTDVRHEPAIFGPKTQNQKFQLSLFFAFSSLSTTQTQTCAKTPIFIVFLANLKREVSNAKLKTQEIEKPNVSMFAPFLKKAIFRKIGK